jgi:hypothetical protein
VTIGDRCLHGGWEAALPDGPPVGDLASLAIGGPSYDVARFARDARAATARSGRPLAVFSPHPHVRDAFARAGVAVFNHESEALAALQSFIAHGSLLRPVPLSPAPESHHA